MIWSFNKQYGPVYRYSYKRDNMKKILKAIWPLMIMMVVLPAALKAQDEKDKQKDIKSLIESKHYVFKAQTALPARGRTRPLNTDFDLRVQGDTLISYLPYFGRAYSAPLNPSQGPLNFTSTDFDYKVADRKKAGWNIDIRPKDVQDPRQMSLSVFENGTASLTVTSNNRQPISFNGYIAAKR
jgi:hypothetical protein